MTPRPVIDSEIRAALVGYPVSRILWVLNERGQVTAEALVEAGILEHAGVSMNAAGLVFTGPPTADATGCAELFKVRGS